MRICLVSTYPPQRCGIGAYTASLAQGLANDGEGAPLVLSEVGTVAGEPSPIVSAPTFRRDQDYGPAVEAAALDVGAELVHVQHAPDIFGMDERLPRLLERLSRRGIASAVTLHTVHTPWTGAMERRFHVARFHRRLGESADAIIVHGEQGMADELSRQGIPSSKIHAIPHGTPAVASVDRAEARKRLGLPSEGHVILFFGFIHLQKNVHTPLLAVARFQRRVPNCRLYLVGSLQNPSWYNRLYLGLLRAFIRWRGLSEQVILREEFVSPEEAALLYAAADLVLLPYAQQYGSASGVVHNALGAGRVPLCSRSPKFAEVGTAVDKDLLVPTHSPGAWGNAIASLLTDSGRRAALTERVLNFAARTAWPVAARQHRALYRSVLSGEIGTYSAP